MHELALLNDHLKPHVEGGGIITRRKSYGPIENTGRFVDTSMSSVPKL